MGLDLILLASGAPLDVVHDPLVHSRPLIEFFGFPDYFISSRMSSCGVVMDFL